MRILIVTLCALCYGTAAAQESAPVRAWLDSHMEFLTETYVWFHQHPELSFEEKVTAEKLSQHWQAFGYDVTSGVGGHGLVGIMKNGDGPTLMLRCDLDALPVRESTPLPIASRVTVKRADGGTTGVMHACGHDVHMTNLVGAAKFLSEHRSLWSGTLMLVGQPAEERGAGAKAMLDDGLFTRFTKPDYALALHASADKPAGSVAVLPGFALANVDSVDITIKGRGGHGSAPHTTVDPIVQAAHLIVDLQSIVSREIKPLEPAVVTVGSIHGGTKHNIIGNACQLQLTVRSYSDDVRQQLREAIQRKTKAVALSFRAPEPEIKFSEGTPALRNSDDLAVQIRKVFEAAIGEANVASDEPSMGGEDFSRYGRAGVPILMYRLGTVEQRRLDRFQAMKIPPPSLHSAEYYPDFEPTIRTGVITMTAAALKLLSP